MHTSQVREWLDTHIPADVVNPGDHNHSAPLTSVASVAVESDDMEGRSREPSAQGRVPDWVMEEEIDMGKVAAASQLAAEYDVKFGTSGMRGGAESGVASPPNSPLIP
jgi:hypothetical protein